MKKWSLRSLVLALVLAAAWLLRATVLADEPVAVRTERAERGRVEATVTNSKVGTVEARRRAGLTTGTAGIVVRLEVERGDRVAAGQVLLRLDDSTQRSEARRAEQELALARARHARACLGSERARREWERNQELAEQQFVSVDRLDALLTAYELARADCQVAAAEVELAGATLAVAQAELAKTVLRAPFDAIIADVAIELGEWATPSVPLVTAPDLIDAIDPSSLYVSAPMDEVDAELLAVGQRVRTTIDSFPDRSFPGKIVRVAPFVLDVEQQNRTLEVEVELDDQELSSTLLPGTSADVEVVLEVREDVLRIPSWALIEGSRVLVLEDGRIAERRVETGIRNWDWTEVLSGLDVGAEVVTSLDRLDVEPGAEARREGDEGPE